MTITPHGRGSFIVTSHGEDYVVDTLSNKGSGQCSCWAFARIKKDLEEAIKDRRFNPSTPRFKCPHILFADAHLLQLFKNDLMAKYPDSDQSKQP